jgi:hypothetical protein
MLARRCSADSRLIDRKNSPSHDLMKAEGVDRAGFERSAELMRERNGPSAN